MILETLIGLGGLAAGASARPLLSRMQSYLSSSKSMADKVLWGLLATPGILWNKDGSFTAVFSFSGPDQKFSTDAQARSLAYRVQRALGGVGERKMVHFDAVRIPSRAYHAGSHSPPVGEFVTDLRRRRYQSGAHYETRHFLAFSYVPPKEVYQQLEQVFYKGGPGKGARQKWEDLCADFEGHVDAFTSRVPGALKLGKLRGSDLLSYLNLSLNGKSQKVNLPPGPALLDFLHTKRLKKGFEPRHGRDWIRAVTVQGYPSNPLRPNVLEKLNTLPFPYRFTTRCVGTSLPKARKVTRRRMTSWSMQMQDGREQMQSTASGDDSNRRLFMDLNAEQKAFDAQEVLRKLNAGEAHMLHTTQTVVVRASDYETCNHRALEVEKKLRQEGFIAERENSGATEAFLGSLAGHGHYNVRSYPLLSDAVSRMVPITTTYPGPETNPCSKFFGEDAPPLFHANTRQQSPYRFTPYVGEVGHQIIVGPTGMGKSVFMGFQALRHLQYEGAQVVLLDKGDSFAPLCEAVGGVTYDITGSDDGEGTFQPLRYIDDGLERQWIIKWLLTIAEIQGLTSKPGMRNHLSSTLKRMAERPKRTRTMQELKIQVQDPALKSALAPYAGGGSADMLLNARSDKFEDARFHVIKMGQFLKTEEAIATPTLLYLIHRIEGMLSPTKPTYVGADEFFMFAAKSEIGREYVENALREYRKSNAAMTLATQAPQDVVGADMASILGSCSTQIYLPNEKALDPKQREAYEEVGLNNKQIAKLSEMEPQSEYLARQPARGTRVFDLALGGSPELAFLTDLEGYTLEETAGQMRKHKEKFGARWIKHWVERCGFAFPPDMQHLLGASPLEEQAGSTTKLDTTGLEGPPALFQDTPEKRSGSDGFAGANLSPVP